MKVIAIDGPAGSGKSTVARQLAKRLGLGYLDTGAMYRALALAVLEAGADPADPVAVAKLAEEADLRLDPVAGGGVEVLLGGEPVEERIRSRRVGEASSVIAAYPEVRRRMVALQRACGEAHGGVVEGRDIGTRVFPDTPHKFFLTARPEVRHRRRYDQQRAVGRKVSRREVVEEIESRDRRDAGRTDSPLVCDERYTVIDTSSLDAGEVVERMAAELADAG